MFLNFSKKKRQVNISDFCYDYYENNIFISDNEGATPVKIRLEKVKQVFEKADPKFSDVSFQKFAYEITIVRFELFALAWMYTFGYEMAIINSVLAKDYLIKKNRNEFWEISKLYNQLFSRNCHQCKSCAEKAIIREQIESSLIKKGYDPECIRMTSNRYSPESVWSDGVAIGLLLGTLFQRLKCYPQIKSMAPIAKIIIDFYQEFMHDLKHITIAHNI